MEFHVKEASGATVTLEKIKNGSKIITLNSKEAALDTPAKTTERINAAIREANEAGGGTVVLDGGEFKCYTIMLKSNVTLCISEGVTLKAARTDIHNFYENQSGEGGNYREPEVNLYAGLQDHGHSYFANSLFYAADEQNIAICGDGCIDGSYFEDGYLRYTLLGGDPDEPEYRCQKGHKGFWFGNKGIALVRCENVVLKDFSLVIGGHFAIIAEGVRNMLIDGVLVDTTRDACDIDCCENVTVRNSVFNSLTDDALVMKASYGAGRFMPLKNVLIEDCTVSGYDAGSVYAGKYTCDKLIASDRCGPTARVKLGTESTCGYELVTIQRVKFMRSRGFALEAVDGSDLRDIIFRSCRMEDISSSPLFIKIGDRGRYPVTGNSTDEHVVVKTDGNVRLDNRGWVLPAKEGYDAYPAKRYTPSYIKDTEVSADGCSYFKIVNSDSPTRINEANFCEENGEYFALIYDKDKRQYIPDKTRRIEETGLPLYANACGSEKIASVENILIEDITVKNADPRYPVIFMGLEDSHIKNIAVRNVDIEYRGGLSMEHAVEQRQLNTRWEYTQYNTAPAIQVLPWLVNTFFLKDEGLLPRADWNENKSAWEPSPYNVPELPGVYPEPSNWGILPAYGMYARHVDGMELTDVRFTCLSPDSRNMLVLDDVHDARIEEVYGDVCKGASHIVTVSNNYKRPTNLEYVKNYPYHRTEVTGLKLQNKAPLTCENVEINAPAPGTPADSLYTLPTAAVMANGYQYSIPTDEYPLPLTVYRPFFKPIGDITAKQGERVSVQLDIRYPAKQLADKEEDGHIYNEQAPKREYAVKHTECPDIEIYPTDIPDGAVFDRAAGKFDWIPARKGSYKVEFGATDGILPIKKLGFLIDVQ